MQKLRHTLFSLFFLAMAIVKGQAYEELTCKVDSIVMEAIQAEAFPGCVVYASKGDSVFFLRSYGHHTYDSLRRVAVNDVYDLASVTKVVGGTLAMMKLYEDGKYHLDDPIGNYIEKIGRKVGRVTFREALAHQGGLHPWIPYYVEVKRKNGKWKRNTISAQLDGAFSYPLSDSVYLHNDFYDKIKRMIRRSKVADDKKYRYSGLFFYLIPELVKNLTDTSYWAYLDTHFYKPLGSESLTFNPMDKFPLAQIVPTEIDTFFRMTPIHGKVHDEGAIMMKGVSANAGLFSNASDLATVFEMLLYEGKVDSIQLLSAHTIRLFTTAQYPNNDNRRGLGFDKPLLVYDSLRSSVAKSASFESYGHTGYTGTMAWADPANDLIFVFLTNRVYPSRNNRTLYQLNVRPTIHQVLSDYIESEIGVNTDPVGNSK